MAYPGAIWHYWWEDEEHAVLAPPPTIDRFLWLNTTTMILEAFRWGDEATPKTGPAADTTDDNFGWR